MGHVRLGRLPKTRRWQEVVALLVNEEAPTAAVAAATLKASEEQLQLLKRDPALKAAIQILVRLAAAGRAKDFVAALVEAGIPISGEAKGPALFAFLRQASRSALLDVAEASPATHIASDALDVALNRWLTDSSGDLFSTGVDHLQAACKVLATKQAFSDVTRDFFSDYLSRWLTYFVDKASMDLVGATSRFRNPDQLRTFHDAMALHARQSSRVIAEFAGSWFSKHHFEAGGQITGREVAGFVSHALTKLAMELRQQAVT